MLGRDRQLLDDRTGAFERAPCGVERRGGGGLGLGPHRGAVEAETRRAIGCRQMAQRRALAHDPGEESGVVDGAGVDADRVEAVGERLDPGAVDQPKARLVADDAAERGRTDHRAGGLRAKAERRHAVGDRGGRAARRAARRMRRVVRVRGFARGERSEFGGDGLAEHDRTGGPRQRHAGRVGRRAGGRDRSASRSRSACPTCRSNP